MRLTSTRPFVEAAFREGLRASDFEPLARAFEQVPSLAQALDSPLLTADDKASLIEPLGLENKTKGAVVLLGTVGLARQLYAVMEGLADRAVRFEGGDVGLLEVAYPLKEEQVQALAQKMARLLQVKKVVLRTVVTPELKGGFRLTAGGLTYDYSLAGMVRDMKAYLGEVE